MASFAISRSSIRPILLLTGIGISALGDFVYLVAINLLVLKITGSAAAVAKEFFMPTMMAYITQLISTGDLFPLRYSLITASLIFLVISLVMAAAVYRPSKRQYFKEGETSA